MSSARLSIEHLLVLGAGVGFLGGDEARTEVGEIGAQSLRRQAHPRPVLMAPDSMIAPA